MISLYPNIFETKNGLVTSLDAILENIKNGHWQDPCLVVMNEKDKDKRNELKKNCPYYTVSGTFKIRSNSGLEKHSGFIAIDFDGVENINALIEILKADQYTYAVFKSVSHTGICVIVRIDPEKHLESFEGLGNYYFNLLRHPIDPACKDVSRPRFVSWDADLFQNKSSKVFRDYPKKEHKEAFYQRTKVDYLHTDDKFERIIQAIDKDITGDYTQWRDIGFAIASKYGEAGEKYYHAVSAFSPKYDHAITARQYKLCCKSGGITISTFYYYVKQAGYQINTPDEVRAGKITYLAKSAGKTAEQIKEIIKKENLQVDESLVDTAFQSNTYNPVNTGGNKLNLDDVELWLKTSYNIRKNMITRFYELDGKELETENLNSIYIKAKKVFEKLTRDLFDTIIFSEHTPSYNPITEYLDSLVWDEEDRIEPLCRSIISITGDFEYRRILLQSWLIGIIESIYTDEPNILQLILAGKQNTGKSHFFKNLLPGPLKKYFGLSQLDKGKDDELLMCQKLLILDDEYSGKSKQDAKLIKRLLSAPKFDLREPYGKKNISLKRIATLCATSNETQLLNDLTGNRRNIIFEIEDQFDYDLYNQVDKEQLFAQIKNLFDIGYRSAINTSMIKLINQFTGERNAEASAEADLLHMFYEAPEIHGSHDHYSTTNIKNHIESNCQQKISLRKLGMELKRLGYQWVKQDGRYGYLIAQKR